MKDKKKNIKKKAYVAPRADSYELVNEGMLCASSAISHTGASTTQYNDMDLMW